jgi:large repetitive protein
MSENFTIRPGALVFLGLLAAASCGPGGAGGSANMPALVGRALTDPSMVTPEVTLPAGEAVASYTRQETVAVATGADVHLVVWHHYENVMATRVRASDGAPLDRTHVALTARGAGCQGVAARPAVAFTAGVFLVVWPTFRSICAVRVQPDGTVLDRSPRVVATSRSLDAPAVIGDGSNFLVAWGDGRVGPPGKVNPIDAVDIYATRVRASDGASLDGDGFVVTNAAGVQRTPAVAFDGSNFFVAWDDPGAGQGMQGLRVRPGDRALLDTPPLQLSQVAGGRPSMIFDGTDVVAVWESGRSLWGRRISPAGQLSGLVNMQPGIAGVGLLSNDASSSIPAEPALGHDGTSIAVAWRGITPTSTDRVRLHWLRFDSALRPQGQPVVLDDQSSFGPGWTTQAMSSMPGKHFVVWNRLTTRQDFFNEMSWLTVHGAVVEAATGSVAGQPLLLSRHAPRQTRPSVSFDGRHHLVVWHEWNGSVFRIRGARLRDDDGVLLDPGGFSLPSVGEGNQVYPLTASNGRNHLVLWADADRLHAVRLRAEDGAILDNPPLSLPAMTYPWASDSPRFGVQSDGENYLVVYAEGGESIVRPVSISTLRIRGTDGGIIGTPVLVTAPLPNLRWPAIAWAQSHYLVSWTELPIWPESASFLRIRRLQPDGALIDPVVTLAKDDGVAPGYLTSPQVVGMGGDLAAVTWNSSDGGQFVRRIRVSDGTPLDAAPLTLLPRYNYGRERVPAMVFDGEHLLVAGATPQQVLTSNDGVPMTLVSEVRLQRIDRQGTLLDPAGLILASSPLHSFDVALSPSPGRRALLAFARHEPEVGLATERMRFRWVGALPPPALPVDAAVPPPVDAAVPPPVDAEPPALPVDAAVPPPVDAEPPAPDVAPPPADAVADHPVPADGFPPGEDAGVADLRVADAGAPADAAGPDSSSAPDAGVSDVGRDGSPVDAARDARSDARTPPADHQPWSCAMGTGRSGPGALSLLMLLAVLGSRRRRPGPPHVRT